jgi:hypothetical protein
MERASGERSKMRILLLQETCGYAISLKESTDEIRRMATVNSTGRQETSIKAHIQMI